MVQILHRCPLAATGEAWLVVSPQRPDLIIFKVKVMAHAICGKVEVMWRHLARGCKEVAMGLKKYAEEN